MHPIRLSLLGFLVLFLTPLALHALWWLSHDTAVDWNRGKAAVEAVIFLLTVSSRAAESRWSNVLEFVAWLSKKGEASTEYGNESDGKNLLEQQPNLVAWKARCQWQPAFQTALAAQIADFDKRGEVPTPRTVTEGER